VAGGCGKILCARGARLTRGQVGAGNFADVDATLASPAGPAEDLPGLRLRQLTAVAVARVNNAWPRLGASAVAAVVAASVVGNLWPMVWCAGLAIVVAIDRNLYRGVLARCAAGVTPKLEPLIAWAGCQSVYGNLLGPILWFGPLPQGETLAMILFCGGLANAGVSLRASPPLLFAGAGPTMAFLLGLPVFEFLANGMAEPLDLLPLVGGLILLGYGFQLLRGLVESDAARLAAESAFVRERQAAAAAARAKSDTLHRVEQALRTPLAALKGATEHLRRTAATPNARLHINQLAQACNVVELALGDLALSAGALRIEVAPCDPRELLRGVINAYRPAAQDKHLELFADIASGTPALLELDALRVRQVLCNLLSNAVRGTAHGGVRVRLSVEPLEREGFVRLAFYVADTGAGMSRSQLAILFESADAEGAGLAVSARLARAMGGKLTAKSALGEGSIVCFALEARVIAANPAMGVENDQACA